jgi:DNA polymerase IIIc chi subunit
MAQEQIVLNIKDSSKLSFLIQLIKQFDFVEVAKVKQKKAAAKYDFFRSAGLWADREVNAQELRKQAWDRTK